MNQFKRWVIFIGALFLTISAALVNGTHIYYMAALLLMLPLISYGMGMWTLRGLEFSREAPTTASEGETVTFSVVVRSTARLPRFFLQVHDTLPEWVVPVEEEPILFNAAPNGETRFPYQVALQKRGAYELRSLTVTALDPLGIYAFTRRVPVYSELVVYPVPAPIPDILRIGAERHGLRDLPIAAVRGAGVDMDGVREYVPGDPLRRVHWKSTARNQRLNVIEFEESRSVNLVLVLDLHKGTDVGEGLNTTLEYLVRAAAGLAQSATRQGSSVRLVAGEAADAAHVTGRGSDHYMLILTALARAQCTDPARLSEVFAERVGYVGPGTTLVVLTADADPALADALAAVALLGTQVFTLYAEPLTFAPDRRSPTQEEQTRYLESMCAARACPLLLRANPERAIELEAAQDVRSYLGNS